jgi:hypothetical protein
LCSKPDCRAPTKAPHTDDDRAVSVGVACHIHAAAPGGPRYDTSQTPEQRSAIDNGIWLCPTCGALIDKGGARFPAALLHEWRKTAEQEARTRVGKPLGAATTLGRPLVELTLGYEKKSISQAIHHYELVARLRNAGTKQLDDWYMEIEFPTPLLEPGVIIGGMVRDRSNASRSLIRTSNPLPPIHSGDDFRARIGYRVNDDIYRNQRHLFDEIAKARAFITGELVAEAERPIDELQCF